METIDGWPETALTVVLEGEKMASVTNKTVDNSFYADSGTIGPQVCWEVARDGVLATVEATTVARFAAKK